MGAGAIIVALHHEQNIFKMGGMRSVTPVVYICMLIATLAISGVPPFAGFFSKDEILLEAFASGQYLIWAIAVFSAVLTAYYMFRLFFIVFEGKNYHHEHHPHALSWVMKAPLVVLAIGSLGAGFLGLPALFGGNNIMREWLGYWGVRALHVSHQTEWILLGVNITVSLLGIALAYVKFKNFDLSKAVVLEGLVYHKFYIDELYDKLFVQSLKRLSERIAVTIDVQIVNTVVMGLSHGFIRLGMMISVVQNANVRFYAFVMILGASSICAYLIFIIG